MSKAVLFLLSVLLGLGLSTYCWMQRLALSHDQNCHAGFLRGKIFGGATSRLCWLQKAHKEAHSVHFLTQHTYRSAIIVNRTVELLLQVYWRENAHFNPHGRWEMQLCLLLCNLNADLLNINICAVLRFVANFYHFAVSLDWHVRTNSYIEFQAMTSC